MFKRFPRTSQKMFCVTKRVLRKVLKGGGLIATDGNCSIGPPLTERIDTFLGIAGANYGLCLCQFAQTIPAWCNALDGLYPGYTCEDQVVLVSFENFIYIALQSSGSPAFWD